MPRLYSFGQPGHKSEGQMKRLFGESVFLALICNGYISILDSNGSADEFSQGREKQYLLNSVKKECRCAFYG